MRSTLHPQLNTTLGRALCVSILAGFLAVACGPVAAATPAEELKALRAETKEIRAKIAEIEAPIKLAKARQANEKAKAKLQALQK